MKCSVSAQEKKKEFNCRAENVQRRVYSTARLNNSVLKCRSQQQARICISKIHIRMQKNSPGACFVTHGHRSGVLVSVLGSVSVQS